MIAKILFTLAIILFVYLLARSSRSRSDIIEINPQQCQPVFSPLIKRMAIILAFVMAIILSLLIWDQWRIHSTGLTVRIVNINTEEFTEYKALRRDINDRDFTTLSGKQIILSPFERLEIVRQSN